jgi:hypothetical protein
MARYGTAKGPTWRTLFKILMPAAWLDQIRKQRTRATGTA